MLTSSSFCCGEGVEISTKVSKREGLLGSQFLEGVDGKERVDLFWEGGLQFSNKLKSEIFHDKKSS